MRSDRFHVYILASKTRRLYVGVTNDLERRVAEHKEGRGSEFTAKYSIHRLVFAEEFSSVKDAIAAEKEIKGWIRSKKLSLMEKDNPEWRDLSLPW